MWVSLNIMHIYIGQQLFSKYQAITIFVPIFTDLTDHRPWYFFKSNCYKQIPNSYRIGLVVVIWRWPLEVEVSIVSRRLHKKFTSKQRSFVQKITGNPFSPNLHWFYKHVPNVYTCLYMSFMTTCSNIFGLNQFLLFLDGVMKPVLGQLSYDFLSGNWPTRLIDSSLSKMYTRQ